VAEYYIDHLPGLRKSTLYDYRAYLKNDIAPALGALPPTALSRGDVARWTQAMSESGASGKTIGHSSRAS
jgi:hypothetical protein